ncbi:TPA: LysR family transcriptional regulator [Vibrio vulnificus]|nr:LysR family transcriptional regulator [Vibrio vulnificus]
MSTNFILKGGRDKLSATIKDKKAYLLSVFKVVAECSSVRAAAKLLLISASTITRMMKELESIYGFELYKKINGQLKLTYKGKRLLKEISKDINRLESHTFIPRAQLHVGCRDVLINKLNMCDPNMDYTPLAGPENEEEVYQLLSLGDLDVHIGFGKVYYPSIENVLIKSIPIVSYNNNKYSSIYGYIPRNYLKNFSEEFLSNYIYVHSRELVEVLYYKRNFSVITLGEYLLASRNHEISNCSAIEVIATFHKERSVKFELIDSVIR